MSHFHKSPMPSESRMRRLSEAPNMTPDILWDIAEYSAKMKWFDVLKVIVRKGKELNRPRPDHITHRLLFTSLHEFLIQDADKMMADSSSCKYILELFDYVKEAILPVMIHQICNNERDVEEIRRQWNVQEENIIKQILTTELRHGIRHLKPLKNMDLLDISSYLQLIDEFSNGGFSIKSRLLKKVYLSDEDLNEMNKKYEMESKKLKKKAKNNENIEIPPLLHWVDNDNNRLDHEKLLEILHENDWKKFTDEFLTFLDTMELLLYPTTKLESLFQGEIIDNQYNINNNGYAARSPYVNGMRSRSMLNSLPDWSLDDFNEDDDNKSWLNKSKKHANDMIKKKNNKKLSLLDFNDIDSDNDNDSDKNISNDDSDSDSDNDENATGSHVDLKNAKNRFKEALNNIPDPLEDALVSPPSIKKERRKQPSRKSKRLSNTTDDTKNIDKTKIKKENNENNNNNNNNDDDDDDIVLDDFEDNNPLTQLPDMDAEYEVEDSDDSSDSSDDSDDSDENIFTKRVTRSAIKKRKNEIKDTDNTQQKKKRRKSNLLESRKSATQVEFSEDDIEDSDDDKKKVTLKRPPKPLPKALPKSPKKTKKAKKRNSTGSIKKTKRVRWQDYEVENLLEGIKQYGFGNWAQIRDSFSFNNRSSQDIRDKYRNLEKNGKI